MTYKRTPISLGGTAFAASGRRATFDEDAHPLASALYSPVWSRRLGHPPILSRIQAPEGRPYPVTVELNPLTEAAKEALFELADPARGEQWFVMEGDGIGEVRVKVQSLGIQRGPAPSLWKVILWAPDVLLESVSAISDEESIGQEVTQLALTNAGDADAEPRLTIRPMLAKGPVYGLSRLERVIIVNNSELPLRDPHSRGGLGRGYPVYLAENWDTRGIVRDSGTVLTTIADGGDGIDASQTTIGVASVAKLPKAGMAWLGAQGTGEQILWRDIDEAGDDLLLCERGIAGTTAQSHAESANVYDSRMMADGHDFQVQVNGALVPPARITVQGPNSAATNVILPLELPAKVSAPLLEALADPRLTLSGEEITDAVRAVREEGDGRDPERSFGVWEAATNLISNGGFEPPAGVATWLTGGGNVLTAQREPRKFGYWACRATYVNSTDLCYWSHTITAAVHSFSAWVYIPSDWDGGTIRLRAANFAGATGTLSVDADMDLTDQWQRLELTFTPNAGDLTGDLLIDCASAPTAGKYIYIDGCQSEQNPIPTPFVDAYGGAGPRNAARVQMPAGFLDETQGWAAFRLRMGWPYNGEPVSWASVMDWFDDSSNYLLIQYRDSTDQWKIERKAGGASGGSALSAVQTFVKGDELTLIAYWTAEEVGISIDGAAFTIQAPSTVAIPVLSASTIDLGQRAGTSLWLDSDILWAAFGTGRLSNLEAADLAALGATAPGFQDIAEGAGTTAIWTASDGNLDTPAAVLQSGIEAMPPSGRVRIGTEVIRYGRRDLAAGRLLDLIHGTDGTTAAAHAAGAQVDRVPLDIRLAYGWTEAPTRPTNPDPIAFDVALSGNAAWDWTGKVLFTSGQSPGAWVAERTGANRLAGAVFLDDDGSGGTRFRDIGTISNLLPYDSVTLLAPCGIDDISTALRYDLAVDPQMFLQIITRDMAGVSRLFGNRHGHEEAGSDKYHRMPETITARNETFVLAGVQSAVTFRARQSVVVGAHLALASATAEALGAIFATGSDMTTFVLDQATRIAGFVMPVKKPSGDRAVRLIISSWDGLDPASLRNVVDSTNWQIATADLDSTLRPYCWFPPEGDEVVLPAGFYLAVIYYAGGTTGTPETGRSAHPIYAAGAHWEHDGNKMVLQNDDLIFYLLDPETDNQEDAPSATGAELVLEDAKATFDPNRTPTVSRQTAEDAYHIMSSIRRQAGETLTVDYLLALTDHRPALEIDTALHSIIDTEFGEDAAPAVEVEDRTRWLTVAPGSNTFLYTSRGALEERVTLEGRSAWQS